MSDGFEVDVQGLQDDAPPDTNASLVALARELVEVNNEKKRQTRKICLLSSFCTVLVRVGIANMEYDTNRYIGL